MDLNTFRDISYGMYIISTKYQQRNVGCFINTLVQITSENPIISISVNKQNYTNEAIRKVKKFAISILSEQTKADVIGKFGFFSSKNTDKFDNVKYENIDEMPIVKENICGYLICELLNIVDCNTHDIIIAKVIDAQKENNYKPMTYGYYHEVIKGTAPKTAPTYIEKTKEKEVKSMNKYECIACGYVYDEEVEGTKWEDLPEDWKCPLCGVGKDMFKKIEE